MNTKIYTCIAATMLLASCKSHSGSTIEIDIADLPDLGMECCIEALPISPIGSSAINDTVKFSGGKICWDLPHNDTVYQVSIMPALSDKYNELLTIKCFAQSGDNITIDAKYTGDAIIYQIEGNDAMRTYAAHKMDYREKLRLLDSDRDRWQAEDDYYLRCIEYAKAHISEPIAAIYLGMMANDHTLAQYADSMPDNVRHGYLGALLDGRLKAYDMVSRVRDENNNPRIGAPMPQFACLDIDGNEISSDHFAGKYVVLDFWGTWCRWCMAGIEPMGKLYHDNIDKMVLIGVNSRDDEDTYRKAIAERHMDWPQIANKEGADEDLALTYAVGAYPTKVVIAPDGTLAIYHEGEDEEFYNQMKKLLK